MANEPPEPPQSDEALMRRAQWGDRAAFSVLYDRYSSAVASYLYRMLGNVEEIVESIHQEVFLRAFRFAPTYRHPQKVSAWLFAIARNVAINHPRATIGDPSEETLTEPNPEWANVLRVATSDFSGQADMARILKQLDTLSTQQKEVIVLGVFQRLSYAQMEMITGTPANTLRARMAEGLRKLAGLLGGEDTA